jgi:type II secretory pathway pseudopilin PulG
MRGINDALQIVQQIVWNGRTQLQRVCSTASDFIEAVIMPRRQRGFALIEATLVMVIIGVLLMLLIPGIANARREARRMSCLNNLRNVGLALCNYHDLHSTYPPGYISRNVTPLDPAEAETGPGWGWGSLLMPFLDQGPMAASFSFELNIAGASTLVPTMRCPEDNAPPFGVNSAASGLVMLPPANYVGVYGYGSLSLTPGRPTSPGIFYRNSRVTMDDVTDGLSETFLIGERRFSAIADGFAVPSESTWLGVVNGVTRSSGLPGCDREEAAGSFVLGTSGQDAPCPWQYGPNSPAVAGFSSAHMDGLNMLRADSSASFISDSIDPAVFRKMTGIRDAQPVDEPPRY